MAADLYSGKTRRLGPVDHIPLSAHAIEVGLIAQMAGASSEVVCAAVLHDALEDYVPERDPRDLRSEMVDRFGEEVTRLVEEVTEIPKKSGSWLERKLSVLDKLVEGDTDAATVLISSKISTLATGNVFLENRCDSWSKGSHGENVQLFQTYLELFEMKNVPPVLLKQLDHELSCFTRLGAASQGSSNSAEGRTT